MAALVGAGRVARELDEVEPVMDRERRDEQRLSALVVTGNLAPELADPRP